MVTGASEWKVPYVEGIEITLPSGKAVSLRPVSMDTMLLQGKISDLLTPLVAKAMWEETPADEIASKAELAKGFSELVNTIIPAAVLSPKVITSGEPGEDEILLDWIEFGDRTFIFQLVIQPVELLYSFRDEQRANLDAVPTGEESGDEAEPVRVDDQPRPVDSVST